MDTYLDAFFYVYLPFAITCLILFALVIVLRVTERKHPRIKYLSVSSNISFILVLMLMLIRCYMPYVSKDCLYYLSGVIWIAIGYLPYLITLGIVSFLGVGVNLEDPIMQCIVFAVSFVLYTLLIFVVIRIALYLKKGFGPEGN